MKNYVAIWYVSSLRLCNFNCSYCVSTGDFSKSKNKFWARLEDKSEFQQVVKWIGELPFEIGLRMATLGEPFTSKEFLSEASWLSKLEKIRFVELVTNGSLLKSILPKFSEVADLSKFSLWVTYHHKQIEPERLIDNIRFAQEEYGCFAVLNTLLFPENIEAVQKIRNLADTAGIRFNLDLGYDISKGHYGRVEDMVPMLRLDNGKKQIIDMGIDPELLEISLLSLGKVGGQVCSSGHNYFFIWINGDVYPCSRYCSSDIDKLGNVLDPGFQLKLRTHCWEKCKVEYGCSNKEDFLHMKYSQEKRYVSHPSLGWTDSIK